MLGELWERERERREKNTDDTDGEFSLSAYVANT